MTSFARRRSVLSVPGGSAKMLAKAPTLAADELMLDLEDGTALGEKDEARARVVDALRGTAFEGRTVAVRVNAIGTAWCHEDVIALGRLQRPGLTLVVPKLESAADLGFADRLLRGVEWPKGPVLGLQGLIETAAGLAHAAAIGAASDRLEALILGYGDLASSLGRDPAAGWEFAQDTLLLAARNAGVQAIDGPHFSWGPEAQPGLEAAARHAARTGFDGKWAIHPSQVEIIEAAFTPSAADVARARAIVAALDAAQAEGRGVTSYEGSMIDEAMRDGAVRVLTRAAP